MHQHFDGRKAWQRQAGWLMAAAGVLTLGGCLGSGKGGPRVSPTATPSATPTGTLTPQPTPTVGVQGLIGRIAFTSARSGNAEIYTIDSFETRQITNDSPTFPPTDLAPALSPDGNRIAWASNRREASSSTNDLEIIIADSTGDKQTALTANSILDSEPTFSPNSQQIAFARDTGNGSQIYIMDAADTNGDHNGDNLRQVTTAGGTQPFFSRDGSKIVFAANRNAGTQLYTINTDGSGEALLVDDSTGIESSPHWSPNSDRVVYALRAAGTTAAGTNSSIRIVNVNADGTGSGDAEIVPATSSNIDPAWRPDGRQIVFASNRSGATSTDYSLFTVNLDGSNITPLRDGSGQAVSGTAPDWRNR